MGVLILELVDNGSELKYSVLFSGIGEDRGGFAIDTFDGETIFAVFKQNKIYTIVEYRVQYQLNNWSWALVSERKTTSKVIDVDVARDFAVVQGLNHHEIYFYGIDPMFTTFSNHNKNIFSYPGLRDFDFFNRHHSGNAT